ncbi:Na+/H+ antiporter [Planctomicrobium piriforme]|uniref:Monovalent cation:H+ antiporter, CPA1 family n=1 Tax=Planctomicrobium piriforme TaxID=1576369 RepID=A0A1I3CGA2_9PLAN|nr:Na+/H+ antiporter [Planctomicrobium piriforme]SFH73495.1 monovalent cation:H+ antiporter, CPA1 family [Planctomicrobium piriforme]
MNPAEIIIGLIFVATVLSAVAQRVGVAYPIVLMVGGLLLSLFPALPQVQLDPEVVFLVFIPPLVYLPASQVGLLDVRSSWFPILMLSVGLVLVSLIGVATVAQSSIPGFTWPTAFLLAAIVAPTDMIAVMAITRHSPLPRQVERTLNGESLFNDVVAFVAYKIALRSVSEAYFARETFLEFTWDVLAGVAAGLVIGQLAIWVRRRVRDPAINSAASLLTAFAAYLTGEAVGASGVLATVTAGLCVGRELSRILEPEVRQTTFSFWSGLNFILEGLAFILIGLELRPTLAQLSETSPWQLMQAAALVIGAVVLLRVIWVAGIFTCRRIVRRVLKLPADQTNWRHAAIVSWAGPRGVESLAAAIGIPLLLPDGTTPFPQREMILFLSFSVILFTLLVQGGTLPRLIRWLHLPPDGSEKHEENLAHVAAAQAALIVLNQPMQCQSEEEFAQLVVQLRHYYEQRLRHYQSAAAETNQSPDYEILMTSNALRLRILNAEREAVIQLRDQGIIGNSVLRRLERSLDFEQIRLTS